MDETRTCASRYTVVSGDSYYSIAQKFQVDVGDLVALNPDHPPARLMVGDVLCIPTRRDEGGSGSTSGGTTGDTGSGSTSGGTSGGTGSGGTSGGASQAPDACPRPEDACPANRRTVVQNDQTAADLQLKYNLSYYTLQRANATTNLDTIRGGDTLCIPEQNQPCPVPPTYTLQTGDTLESVALAYRLPVGQLLRANPCLAPDDFAPGVTVRLPGQ